MLDILAASTGTGIYMAIGGIVAVVAISAAFYAVGRGEDRDRAAAAHTAQPDDGEPGEARAAQPRDEPAEARMTPPSGAPERRRRARTQRRRRR